MLKRVICAVLSAICIINALVPGCALASEVDEVGFIDMMISQDREPITSFETANYGTVNYNFVNGNRLSKQASNMYVSYSYDENNYLINENGIYGNISYIPNEVVELNVYYGFIYNNSLYKYSYDDVGNVVSILDSNNNEVCKYEYHEGGKTYEVINNTYVLNDDPNFIGNVNPIRYHGWYYDFETGLYHTGEGVFYNLANNTFIMNDLHVAVPFTSQVQLDAARLYERCMNTSSFHSQRANVTQTEWNNGERWYDGLSATEICARLIIAENPYVSRGFDRVAIAGVVANRIRKQYQGTDLMSVITKRAQFSTINPGIYKTCDTARASRSTSSDAWKMAVMLACVLTYSADLDEVGDPYNFPTGFLQQLHFYSVSGVIDESSFTVSGGKMYQNGHELKDVLVATGYGLLEIPNSTTKAALLSSYRTYYNLFYSYK